MFNTNDSNSIFGNLNQIISNFIPADSHKENNQVIKPLKIIIYFFLLCLIQLLMSIGAKSHGTITCKNNKSI